MRTTYQEALDYIYSFIDPTRKGATTDEEANRNLLRMRTLLADAGNPHHSFRSVVIAGTKGKGSTAALVEAIVRAARWRTGLFTSPHLHSYRERFQIDRTLISQADLISLVATLQPVIDRFDAEPYGRPTTFDLSLLLALHYFANQSINLAVLEIGLGGRFDAVNVVTPIVAGISSISYDHMAILGTSLAEIAWNKAGIIKSGVPVVTVPQADEVMHVLMNEATLCQAPLWQAEPTGLMPVQASGTPMAYPIAPEPALQGLFQNENARLALGIALLLEDTGFTIGAEAMRRGLAEVRWPGRFELLPGTPPVLIDGAHNGDSAHKLIASLKASVPYERLILVFGTSRDKAISDIAAELVPPATTVILTRSAHTRAMDLDRMVAAVTPHLQGTLLVKPDVATALQMARELANPHDLILVTGSLFVVAAARESLGLAVAD
ncbi:bifunctional folylpolyglutamate synthase/dihydrofolate synthase [Candidatus Chloroploca asiatica]|uniref:tetrahydrofolate synthase n=1 Tax=Candidatus Chloroploca asiatica TaxID=1506545 RepID=A0A2H3KRI2_9CHLR|nr:folylpolyglutamate synthase/dihydrofolate synthase family protein [Candidatus Chloroploca asiatica]PDW01221.1 bifunctional folylpolyglutamate synthase/dihydrofolate synthase [Candidatus Chloroploca asiatica]